MNKRIGSGGRTRGDALGPSAPCPRAAHALTYTLPHPSPPLPAPPPADLREFCTHAADHEHKRLILAGLDGDFQRRRFGQVLDLLPLADSVTKLSARCKYCAEEAAATAGQQQQLGQLQQHQLGQGQQQHASSAASAAVFSLRLVATADGRQELVGGADVYAPVCRRHYVQLAGVGAGEGGAAAVQQQGSSSAGGGGGA